MVGATTIAIQSSLVPQQKNEVDKVMFIISDVITSLMVLFLIILGFMLAAALAAVEKAKKTSPEDLKTGFKTLEQKYGKHFPIMKW